MLGMHPIGRLAQLVRAPCLHRGCRGFESLIAHLKEKALPQIDLRQGYFRKPSLNFS